MLFSFTFKIEYVVLLSTKVMTQPWCHNFFVGLSRVGVMGTMVLYVYKL